MSLLDHLPSTRSPALRLDELEDAGASASPVVGGRRPPAVVACGSTETVESLLLSVARGDQEAVVALQGRIAGLVRLNVRRVLHDASRSEAVTQATLVEVLENAIHFDPYRTSAQAWVLTRAHQRVMEELRFPDGTDDPHATRTDQAATVWPPVTPNGRSGRRLRLSWLAR